MGAAFRALWLFRRLKGSLFSELLEPAGREGGERIRAARSGGGCGILWVLRRTQVAWGDVGLSDDTRPQGRGQPTLALPVSPAADGRSLPAQQ